MIIIMLTSQYSILSYFFFSGSCFQKFFEFNDFSIEKAGEKAWKPMDKGKICAENSKDDATIRHLQDI